MNPGTSRAEFVNVSDLGDNYAYGGDVLTKGSFVRIGGVDGKLYGINQTSGFQEDALSDRGGNVTLHTAFTLDQGAHVAAHTGKMVVDAYVVAPPPTCLRQTATAAAVRGGQRIGGVLFALARQQEARMRRGDVLVEALRILRAIHRQLDHTQLERIVLRHRRRIFHHLVIQPVARHDPVDQPQRQRLFSIDEAAFEQDLLRLSVMDVPRDAEILEVGAQEHSVLRREDDIHRGSDDPAAEDAIAVHRRDGRLLHIAPAQGLVDELLARVVVAAAHALFDRVFGGAVFRLLQRAEIVPGGEVIARPAQHDHPHVEIEVRPLEGVVHLDQHRRALRVAVARPVRGAPRDPVNDLISDVFVFHGLLLRSKRVVGARHPSRP